jgi:hypothetical protein
MCIRVWIEGIQMGTTQFLFSYPLFMISYTAVSTWLSTGLSVVYQQLYLVDLLFERRILFHILADLLA